MSKHKLTIKIFGVPATLHLVPVNSKTPPTSISARVYLDGTDVTSQARITWYQQARAAYPAENDREVWDRAIKAYKLGAGSLRTREPAIEYSYVRNVRSYQAKKPWLR